uniref:Uncharacterized protein n=1 Tax=Erpetoichthys calabaricus TaxID=27687 RepID=A0A8C4RF01_ERPCA
MAASGKRWLDSKDFAQPQRPLGRQHFETIRWAARTAWDEEGERAVTSATTYGGHHGLKILDEASSQRVRPSSPTSHSNDKRYAVLWTPYIKSTAGITMPSKPTAGPRESLQWKPPVKKIKNLGVASLGCLYEWDWRATRSRPLSAPPFHSPPPGRFNDYESVSR